MENIKINFKIKNPTSSITIDIGNRDWSDLNKREAEYIIGQIQDLMCNHTAHLLKISEDL
jgi:hypothetical protein